MRRGWPSLVLPLVLSFALATWLEPRWKALTHAPGARVTIMARLLGESRRLLAGQALITADRYYHMGYYPSVFELAEQESNNRSHMMETPAGRPEHGAARTPGSQPLDWLEWFSRHFHPSVHVHADEKGTYAQKEILPWLRIAAELDPENPQVYVLGGFWLRTRLNRIADAEAFLRDGLRANPGSPEILCELGRLYFENRKEPAQAVNLLELAWKRWQAEAQTTEEPDIFLRQQIATQLAQAETQLGHWLQAIHWLEELKKYSPNPEAVTQRIEELRQHIPRPP